VLSRCSRLVLFFGGLPGFCRVSFPKIFRRLRTPFNPNSFPLLQGQKVTPLCGSFFFALGGCRFRLTPQGCIEHCRSPLGLFLSRLKPVDFPGYLARGRPFSTDSLLWGGCFVVKDVPPCFFPFRGGSRTRGDKSGPKRIEAIPPLVA